MIFLRPPIQGGREIHPLFPGSEDDFDVPSAAVEIGGGLRVHLFGHFIGCDEVPAAALLLCNGEGVAPFPGFYPGKQLLLRELSLKLTHIGNP